MRRVHGWLAMCVFLMAVGMATRADDDKEEKVPLDKVPEAVLKAVKAKFKGAELLSAQTEKEDGKTLYEINLKDKGHSVDVSLTADGEIVSIERTIDAKDLPKPVMDALNSKYPKAEFKTIEEVTEKGKTNYEVLLVTSEKKTFEVVFDKDGKIVKEEAKDKKD
jgi:uncharacterized membrane protein YkoI